MLSDTFGFPIDLTKEILSEKGMSVDEDKFRALVLKQRETARASRKNAGADAWVGDSDALEGIEKTAFVGYAKLNETAKITALVKDGARVESAEAGDDIVLTLDRTPFYAESGGQVGDSGVIKTDSCTIRVIDTTKNASGVFIHKAIVEEGFVRELISKVQTMRKEAGFEVVDRIAVTYQTTEALSAVLSKNAAEISTAVLATDFTCAAAPEGAYAKEWNINGEKAVLSVRR